MNAPRTWLGFVGVVLIVLVVRPVMFAVYSVQEGWQTLLLPAWRELRGRH